MSLSTMNKPVTHFLITEADDFLPSNFPQIVKELDDIKELVKPLRHVDNEIIILSYLKDHSVRADLAESHPRIIEVLTAKNVCHSLENLFRACKNNSRFQLSLENFVIDQLNK